MSHTSLRNRKGFTLIEILVATTIMVITVSAIYVSFSGGMASWTKGTARMERFLNARAALDMMSREIRAAFIIDTGTYANQFFYGDGDEVTFVAPLRTVTVGDEAVLLRTVKYQLNPAPDTNELWRIKEDSIDSNITDVVGPGDPLVSHITGLSFQYHYGTNWLAEGTVWDSTGVTSPSVGVGRLPEAVRITITIQDELRHETPQTFSTIVYLPLSR